MNQNYRERLPGKQLEVKYIRHDGSNHIQKSHTPETGSCKAILHFGQT
jgi:hypothetical protein